MSTAGRNYEDQPTYWFVILERAVERRNVEAAAHAKRQLARLGVEVKFRPPCRQEAVAP